MTDNELVERGVSRAIVRSIIWVVFAAAVLYAVASVVFGAIGMARAVGEGRVTTTLAAETALPPQADTGTATLEHGTFESARVTVSDLSAGTMTLVTIADVAAIVASVSIAIALAVLCRRLLAAKPFQRSLSWTVTVSGAVVMLSGLLSVGLGVIGSWMIADQLNADAALNGFWPTAAPVDLSSVALGIALLLVGLVFEYGERLQSDTAGLV